MRRGLFGGVGLIIALAVVILAYLAFYTVDPTKHALVLRFGQTIRSISEPGLYAKVPLIDNVIYIEKRLLDLDSPPLEVNAGADEEDLRQPADQAAQDPAAPADPAADLAAADLADAAAAGIDDTSRKRLVVDAFGRYRVIDPLLFYQAVGSEARANDQLSTILQSAVRRVIGDASFTDIVRDRRAELMRRITEQVDAAARGFGIEVVDVKIRRADLPEANSQAVYQRMQTERQRVATGIRADGEQRARTIRANADRESTVILANANRESEQIRGVGDAQRNRIFADAFGRDPDFFAFYRSMQAYREGLPGENTRLLISPDSDFFRFFGDLSGANGAGPRSDAATPPPATELPGPGAALAPPDGAAVLPPNIQLRQAAGADAGRAAVR